MVLTKRAHKKTGVIDQVRKEYSRRPPLHYKTSSFLEAMASEAKAKPVKIVIFYPFKGNTIETHHKIIEYSEK
jgi:hypothetical protein